MKLVRIGEPGGERPALIDPKGSTRDLSGEIADICGAMLSPEALAKLSRIDPYSLPLMSDPVRVGPCVGAVTKIVCIGLNYHDHATEAGMNAPAEPVVFLKATSAITGPNDDLAIPDHFRKCDWEVELGVVIGSRASGVAVKDALRHVAGYCVFNDISERALQLESTGQWTKGKSFDGFAPLGPWLVTRDEVPDPHDLQLWLNVDGGNCQHGHSGKMIFRIDQLIAYVTSCMTLLPGDVIATGTPPGVGMGARPPRFLQPGSIMIAGITGLGQQVRKVVRKE